MIEESYLEDELSARTADWLNQLLDASDFILIKKLSNNDRDWARYPNKHQAGVYIPFEQRDSGFFPGFTSRVSDGGSEIRECYFHCGWPQSGEAAKRTRLVHYTSKGQETHLTGLPKDAFRHLAPASFLVMGRLKDGSGSADYGCLTISSESDEAALLEEIFSLDPEFLIDIFEPSDVKAREVDEIAAFAEELIRAWMDGEVDTFAMGVTMPSTYELAAAARREFMDLNGLGSISPFEVERPGDALRDISRRIEWNLFQMHQRRERAVELVRIVLGDEPRPVDSGWVIRRLVEEIPRVYAEMLSATQQRRARAGQSYEHHIEAMLLDGMIPFEKQVILTTKTRPDFILPSLKYTDTYPTGPHSGLILSAKTTLRERWKQIEREKGDRAIYLTTLDEKISARIIGEMASFGAYLVVPESLLEAKETEYDGHHNVMDFRGFCDDVVRPRLAHW